MNAQTRDNSLASCASAPATGFIVFLLQRFVPVMSPIMIVLAQA